MPSFPPLHMWGEPGSNAISRCKSYELLVDVRVTYPISTLNISNNCSAPIFISNLGDNEQSVNLTYIVHIPDNRARFKHTYWYCCSGDFCFFLHSLVNSCTFLGRPDTHQPCLPPPTPSSSLLWATGFHGCFREAEPIIS